MRWSTLSRPGPNAASATSAATMTPTSSHPPFWAKMPWVACTKPAAPTMTTRSSATTVVVSAPSTINTPPTNSTNEANEADTIASGMPSFSNWPYVPEIPLIISFCHP